MIPLQPNVNHFKQHMHKNSSITLLRQPVGVWASEFDSVQFEKRSEAKRKAKRKADRCESDLKQSETESEANSEASRNEAID